MPLVPAKCTQCGASLEVDNSLEAAICKYCNTAFIVEKAINNYNTYYKNEYHIQNAKLIVQDTSSIENKLKNAEVFFVKHNDKQKAYQLFNEVANEAPDDYRGWWGIVRIHTDDFRYFSITKKEFNTVLHFKTRAFNIASPDILDQLNNTWEKYTDSIRNYTNGKMEQINKIQNEIDNLSLELKEPLKRKEELENTIKQKEKQALSKESRPHVGHGCIVSIVAFILLTIFTWNASAGEALRGIVIIVVFFLITVIYSFINWNSAGRIHHKINLLKSEIMEINKQIKSIEETQYKKQRKIEEIQAPLVILEKDI